MVLYTQADFDKMQEARDRNSNMNTHGKKGKTINKVFDKLNDADCQNSTFQNVIKTVTDLVNKQQDDYDKRSEEQKNKEQIEKRNASKNTVDKYLNTLIIENKKTNNLLSALIYDYENEKIYTNNMKELYSRHISDTSNLKNNVDDYISYIQTDNRKSFYKNQEIEFSNKIRNYILIFYYLLLLVFLWYGSFFQNKLYKNVYVWLMIIIYILIPYVIKYLTVNLFYLLNKFYDDFINTSNYNKVWYVKKH